MQTCVYSKYFWKHGYWEESGKKTNTKQSAFIWAMARAYLRLKDFASGSRGQRFGMWFWLASPGPMAHRRLGHLWMVSPPSYPGWHSRQHRQGRCMDAFSLHTGAILIMTSLLGSTWDWVHTRILCCCCEFFPLVIKISMESFHFVLCFELGAGRLAGAKLSGFESIHQDILAVRLWQVIWALWLCSLISEASDSQGWL